jgi:tetratricopeptide (TPR) repeat protein
MLSNEPGKNQQINEDYTKAIQQDPEDVDAYFNRAMAYFYLGSYREAIKDLDKALELEPKYTVAYLSRGIAYKALGDYQLYIKNFKTAARLGCRGAQDSLRLKGIQASFCERMSDQIKRLLRK